jgi:hypothetical protein
VIQFENTPKAFANLSPLENTPKAFANLSPGLERSDNPGFITNDELKPCKGFSQGEPFQGSTLLWDPFPGFSLRSNPGLKLANAFGVFSN